MAIAFLVRWRAPSHRDSALNRSEEAVNTTENGEENSPTPRWRPFARAGGLTSTPGRATALPAVVARPQGHLERLDVRRLLKARRSEVEKLAVAAQHRIVFDYTDVSAPYTMYTLKLRSEARMDSALAISRFRNESEWRLRKRYSEFHAFRRKLRRWKTEWDSSRVPEGFERLKGVLLVATGKQFPRKHIRYDTEAIIRERRVRLADFVRALLAVYTDLEVLLCVLRPASQRPSAGSEDNACLRRLFLELERFLAVPPKRKEVETRLTRAILALEDVDATVDGDSKAYSCRICLIESDPSETEAGSMVRLPCSHGFHEDCILTWFHCSATCPVCRRGVATPAKAANYRASAI